MLLIKLCHDLFKVLSRVFRVAYLPHHYFFIVLKIIHSVLKFKTLMRVEMSYKVIKSIHLLVAAIVKKHYFFLIFPSAFIRIVCQYSVIREVSLIHQFLDSTSNIR